MIKIIWAAFTVFLKGSKGRIAKEKQRELQAEIFPEIVKGSYVLLQLQRTLDSH